MELIDAIKKINESALTLENRSKTCPYFSPTLCDGSVKCRLYSDGVACVTAAQDNRKLANWLSDYDRMLRKEIEFRPKVLYAIEDTTTHKIIFNARGGCYSILVMLKRSSKNSAIKNIRLLTINLKNKDNDYEDYIRYRR